MGAIANFLQIRADGKEVPFGMSANEILAKGWGVSKVVGLRWTNGVSPVELSQPAGSLGIVVPGSNFVAALVQVDGSDATNKLMIFNGDGSLRGVVEDRPIIEGSRLNGEFSWFESAMTPGDDTFGVAFQTTSGDSLQCDVKASELHIVGVARTR